MNIMTRPYKESDLAEMIEIWNEVVEAGNAFPQEDRLDLDSGAEFFSAQSETAVAVDENENILGLYILHPNNIGRCGHIANASFAVNSDFRGRHVGEKLVRSCIDSAGRLGFKALQFNAVVESNISARRLYEHLGFIQLGVIKNGFRMKDGSFENICPYYIEITKD